MKMFNHTEVMNMSSNREHFTKHGLHMNGMGKECGLHMNGVGKEWTTNRTAGAIKHIFTSQKLVALNGGNSMWREVN